MAGVLFGQLLKKTILLNISGKFFRLKPNIAFLQFFFVVCLDSNFLYLDLLNELPSISSAIPVATL